MFKLTLGCPGVILVKNVSDLKIAYIEDSEI